MEKDATTLYYDTVAANCMHPDIKGIIRDYHRKKANQIAIPAEVDNTNRLLLHELGGLNNRGWAVAMVIAEPKGTMVTKPIAFVKSATSRKPNGRQASAFVWEGCYVGVGNVDRGKGTYLIYKIKELTSVGRYGFDPEDYTKNGVLIMDLIASNVSSFQGDEVWVRPDEENANNVMNMLYALEQKSKELKCMKTFYMNPWIVTNNKTANHVALFENSDFTEAELSKHKITEVNSYNAFVKMVTDIAYETVTTNYLPVRWKMFPTDEEGQYSVYGIVLTEPTFQSDGKGKRDLIDKEIKVTNVVKTIITKTTTFDNRGEGLFFNANTIEQFINNTSNKDYWFIYRGC